MPTPRFEAPAPNQSVAVEQGARPVAPVEGFLHGGLCGHDARAVGRQRRLRLRELRPDLIGVDDGQHLSLSDAIVEVDIDGIQPAGDFGADIDLVLRLQSSRGADRHRQRSARGLNGHIGCRPRAPPKIKGNAGGEPQNDQKRQQNPHTRPEPARLQLQPQGLGDIGVGVCNLFVHRRFRRMSSGSGRCAYLCR
jgi:hypothetical protein